MSAPVLLPSTRRVLEVDRLLAQVAERAETPMGRAAVAAMTACADAREVARRHKEASQVAELAGVAGFAPLAGAQPLVGVLAVAAVPGAILEPEQLGRVAATARVAEALRRRFGRDRQRWPAAAGIADSIAPLAALVEQIDGLLTADGEVRDDASPELRRIRTRLRRLRGSVRRRLERLVGERQVRTALRDTLVTERRGRFVLPVRADQRERVAGIVHDASGSRQTLFVEPQEVVEAQNEIVELEGGAREEVQRLLAAATGHVRAAAEALRRAETAVARADALQAVARWAQEQEAVVAEPEGPLRLTGARHPLIARERFVPLDLHLRRDTRAIVVTGPNTGGKTVALKTLGLLAWMNQAGLPLPAAAARLPVYPRIHADIGDEQSLEASLSTFSGHVAHIVEFLGDCPAGSLVLLDELGTGTDPTEGAALGIALLERFVERGASVFVSTHHDALKAYAHRAEGIVNAAMEFDPRSLEPTYRIRVGRPGRSNALEIARRLGLEPRLVARARSLLDGDSVRLDEILQTLERQEQDTERERERLQQAEERLARLERELLARDRQRERQQQEALAAARQALERELDRVRREGRRRLEELLADVPTRTAADLRARWAGKLGELGAESIQRLQRRPRADDDAARPAAPRVTRQRPAGAGGRPRQSPPGPSTTGAGAGDAPAAAGTLVRGQAVRVRPFDLTGVVLRDWRPDAGAPVEVDLGGKRMQVARGDVTPVAVPVRRRGGVAARHRPRAHVPAELDLHGLRVQDALARVDRYLDDAILAGLSTVRLVHGLGTGRLRRALHAWLARRPHVAGFDLAPPEQGGAGATLVRLGD